MENVVNSIRLDNMTIDDLEYVLEIEENSFSIPWSRESLVSEITKNELAKYIVARSDNVIVGYAGIWKILDEGHITNIAVCPEQRRKKIGSKMVEGLINLANDLGINSLTLEVRESNISAQNLYEKFGFEVCGMRKKYYSDNDEDALIMWKVVK